MKPIIALLVLFASVASCAQGTSESEEATQPTFDGSAIASFSARYVQGGEPLVVTVTRSDGDTPMLHAVFGDPDSPSPADDKIGHRLPDLGFSYRSVAGRTLVADGENIVSVGVRLDGPPETRIEPAQQPVIDGTLSYWLLAAVPLETGATVTPRVVMPDFRTTGGFWSRPAPFVAGDMEEVAITKTETIACRLVTTAAGDGQFEACVSDVAPYLIRQRYLPAAGPPQTILQFETLVAAPEQ